MRNTCVCLFFSMHIPCVSFKNCHLHILLNVALGYILCINKPTICIELTTCINTGEPGAAQPDYTQAWAEYYRQQGYYYPYQQPQGPPGGQPGGPQGGPQGGQQGQP